MKTALRDLIAEAPARLEAAGTQDEQRFATRELALADKEAIKFKHRVQTALGSEVLASLGPVSYENDPGTHAMRFQVDGKGFELRQAIGSVVNLLTGSREIFQFNLSNPEAKDRFLQALGDAIASTA